MFIEIGFASDNKMRVHSIFIKITQLNYTNTPLNHTAISIALMAGPLYNIDNSYLLCVCAQEFLSITSFMMSVHWASLKIVFLFLRHVKAQEQRTATIVRIRLVN